MRENPENQDSTSAVPCFSTLLLKSLNEPLLGYLIGPAGGPDRRSGRAVERSCGRGMRSWTWNVVVALYLDRGRGSWTWPPTLFGSWTWIVVVLTLFGSWTWIVDVAHFIWIVDVDRGRGFTANRSWTSYRLVYTCMQPVNCVYI